MEAIEKIKAAEKQADENKKNAQKKSDEILAAAEESGENFVRESVASAKESAKDKISQAKIQTQAEYEKTMEDYRQKTDAILKAADLNREKAIDAVIAEIF